MNKNPIVTITMENGDVIKAELYPEIAPISVNNFISLINKKFYDGLIFHRVIRGFMIQGGCPNGDGSGTLENKIFGEFPDNGWANDISHKKGVISMVRENDPNTAACQFFICMKDMPELDPQYAAFGYVIAGMSVLEEVMNAYAKYADAEQAGIILEKEEQPVIKYIKWVPDKDGYWASRHS